MRIAVDLSFIRPDHTNGGTESCIRNLIKGWIQQGVIRDFIFFIHQDIYEAYQREFPVCEYAVYRLRGSHKVRTTLFQTFVLPQWVRVYGVDVLYYPTYTTGYYRRLSVPAAVNPHDVQFKFYPEYFSPLKRWYLDVGYRHSLKRADQILAISNYVRDSLMRFYGKECGDKIRVVYDPVDFSQRDEEPLAYVQQPYILSVSSIAKHKNMLTLVRAFARLNDQIPHQLVIVGCRGNGMEEIAAYLKERKLENRICFTDYVKDSNVEWLYRHAALYVTTSLYEGFGMTPVEAMGRGIPTISSRSASLPEVTMEKAVYYEPAEDDACLAERMREVLEDGSFPVPDQETFIRAYDKCMIAKKLYCVLERLAKG